MTLYNNKTLARLLGIAQWVIVATAVICGLCLIGLLFLEGTVNDGSLQDSLAVMQQIRQMADVTLFFFMATCVVTGVGLVLYITWQFRAYRNLKRLELNLQYWAGWGILGFFVPFANYILPVLLLQDQLKQSHRLLNFFSETEGMKPKDSVRIQTGIWWGLYALVVLCMNVMNRFADDDEVARFIVPLMVIAVSILSAWGYFILKAHFIYDQRVYALWESGRIDEYKSEKVMQESGVSPGEKPAWYNEVGETNFQPEVDVFVDQEGESEEKKED